MGLYASVDGDVECPTCGQARPHRWQFYFGAVHDLPVYSLGERIRWDGSPFYGDSGLGAVVAVGYCESEWFCRQCDHEYALADISIVAGRLEGIKFRSLEAHVPELFFVLGD